VIYLDHNATTPLDHRVLETMLPYLENEWGNPSSPYRFASRARIAIERARNQIGECAGCKPEEIIFTSSGTESDNLAVRGTAYALRSRGRHIVTTAIEHHAVLNTCKALESEGFRVTYLPVNSAGTVSIKELENNLTPETILVTVMHANNETGVLQSVREIANLTQKRSIPFHTDAVQTAGKIPYSLCELGAGLISFSGHKLYGPKGIAALYVHEKTPLAPILTGGAQEKGLRAGTENVAGIMGLAHAYSLAVESADREYKRLENLRDRFEERICTAIPGTKINGTGVPRIPNTTNISFDSVDGESIVLGLDLRGICVSTGSACSTGEPEPSHVLVAMGLSSKEAQGSIRISLGRDTGEEEMDTALEAFSDTIKHLRSISSV
jgi:cysteine desulfurase